MIFTSLVYRFTFPTTTEIFFTRCKGDINKEHIYLQHSLNITVEFYLWKLVLTNLFLGLPLKLETFIAFAFILFDSRKYELCSRPLGTGASYYFFKRFKSGWFIVIQVEILCRYSRSPFDSSSYIMYNRNKNFDKGAKNTNLWNVSLGVTPFCLHLKLSEEWKV